MKVKISHTTMGRRALALGVLCAAFLAASLGFAADDALAAYKARVDAGTLTISGDGASDKLVLRLAPGSPNTLEVDVGANGTADFSFDRTTFTAVDVEAGGGDDEVRVDQINGAFPDETLTMNGGDGADTLIGGAGADIVLGGKGNDVVLGGDGNDRASLGDGDDRFEWHPGDDSDVVEGQGGRDLLDFFGGNIGETIDVSANGSHVRFARDIAGIAMDLNTVERVGFRASGGADAITVGDLTGTAVRTVEVDLSAGAGGGDASADTVVAKGTDGTDRVTVASSAGTVFVSGLAAQLQVGGAEAALDTVNVDTLGGADTIATGVGVSGPAAVNVDGGDGADSATYNGTAGADAIQVAANGTAASTNEAASAPFNTTAVESLLVLGLAGADAITSAGNLAPLTALTIDGGDGDDTVGGGNGADTLIGGKGNDDVHGNGGNDVALLGDGDDWFQWNPGDGSDTVDGQAGIDRLDFFGSNIGETIMVVANGSRTRLTRDIAAITMDFDNIEGLSVHAFGGSDVIAIDDLTGTDVETADVDLGVFGGGGDGAQDTILVNGTSKRDVVSVTDSATDVLVSGLVTHLRIAGSERANDTLFLQTLAGDDAVTVAPTVGDLIQPIVNLGADE